jgi:hypothetical protein
MQRQRVRNVKYAIVTKMKMRCYCAMDATVDIIYIALRQH